MRIDWQGNDGVSSHSESMNFTNSSGTFEFTVPLVSGSGSSNVVTIYDANYRRGNVTITTSGSCPYTPPTSALTSGKRLVGNGPYAVGQQLFRRCKPDHHPGRHDQSAWRNGHCETERLWTVRELCHHGGWGRQLDHIGHQGIRFDRKRMGLHQCPRILWQRECDQHSERSDVHAAPADNERLCRGNDHAYHADDQWRMRIHQLGCRNGNSHRHRGDVDLPERYGELYRYHQQDLPLRDQRHRELLALRRTGVAGNRQQYQYQCL